MHMRISLNARANVYLMLDTGFIPNFVLFAGFNEGFIMFDDSNKKGKLSEASGTLPDGDFTTDTTLVFCCRDDGPVIDEIVLPKGKNFVMFMGHRETQCQTVKGEL